MAGHSTITVRSDIKERLVTLKGRQSWDRFMAKVIEVYPSDAAIAELEERLEELRSGKVQAVPWRVVRAGIEERKKRASRAPARRKRRTKVPHGG